MKLANLLEYRGLIYPLAVSFIAYMAAPFIPGTNSILLGFILGVLFGNLFSTATQYKTGIDFGASKLLEISIILLAFSINYTDVAKIGVNSIILIVFTILIILTASFFLSKVMFKDSSVGWLVGFGTAICGSAAIAALSPTVSKNKEDVGISMAIVNILGSIGMISLPFIFELLHTPAITAGVLLGGSLHSVGNVAGAAYAVGDEVGKIAIAIKLARVAMLSPALIFFNFLILKNETQSFKEYLKLPWYLWVFITITIITSIFSIPKEVITFMEGLGKITLTIAMVSIGLKVSFKSLFVSGKKGLQFGLLIFGLQLIVILTFMKFLGFM